MQQAPGTAPIHSLADLPGFRVLADPAIGSDAAGNLVITAAGADEQQLLVLAQQLGTVRELGPVRRPLTEIFRKALTAPASANEPQKENR